MEEKHLIGTEKGAFEMMHDLTGSALKSCLVHDRYRWQLRVPAHSERTAQRSGHAEQSRPADYGVPWTLRTRLNN